MPYANFDDNFPDHPKVLRLSDQAFRLFVTSVCFCARTQSDGALPREVIGRLGATKKLIDELVAAGMWDRAGGDYRVHDYLDWNRSRAEIAEAVGKAKAAANARWNAGSNAPRRAKRNAPSITNGSAPGNAKRNALHSTPLQTTPLQSESEQQQPRARDAEPAIFGFYRDFFGTPNGKADELSQYTDVPFEVLGMAYQEAVRNGGKSWWYVKRILDRLRLSGIIDDPRAVEIDLGQRE